MKWHLARYCQTLVRTFPMRGKPPKSKTSRDRHENSPTKTFNWDTFCLQFKEKYTIHDIYIDIIQYPCPRWTFWFLLWESYAGSRLLTVAFCKPNTYFSKWIWTMHLIWFSKRRSTTCVIQSQLAMWWQVSSGEEGPNVCVYLYIIEHKSHSS